MLHIFIRISFFIILVVKCVKIKKVSEVEKTKEFWYQKGRDHMKIKINQKAIETKAKNIILFVGDGMGIATVTTSRIFKNQRMSDSLYPDVNLSFEDLPNIGLSKTYCVNDYVCDSASTATAILSGVKTNSRVLGLTPRIQVKNCQSYDSDKDNLRNIADLFYSQNKSLGIVTTAFITDATPAAVYANIPHRSWQYKTKDGCPFKDIASQLISKSKMFQVIFGGGRKAFMTKGDTDPEYPQLKGSRTDENLISKWEQSMEGSRSKYIWNKDQFDELNSNNTDYVLGLFEHNSMKFVDENSDDPKLSQMTEKAIEILSKNKNGFFLLVEEANIDTAHHANQAYRALLQTLELEKAVTSALKMIDSEETLLIVTADHSHVMTVGSYATRETDITGVNVGYNGRKMDNKGHSSILYSNGPGFQSPRENITNTTVFTPKSIYYAGVHLSKESHGGEEVAVYSKGPWAHLLKDVYEQSFIGHVMMFASCTGLYFNRDGCLSNEASIFFFGKYFMFTCLLLIVVLRFKCI